MKEFSKWLNRIFMLFLAVLIIDFNCTNLRKSPEKSHHFLLANLVLGGLLVILLIFQINKRRL